jgi:hypothetical protein
MAILGALSHRATVHRHVLALVIRVVFGWLRRPGAMMPADAPLGDLDVARVMADCIIPLKGLGAVNR